MAGATLRWLLVFNPASVDHLAEREIEPEDVADAVFGRHGAVRVRRAGRGERERWFVVAPLLGGELLTCVFRSATPRDLEAEGAHLLPSIGQEQGLPVFQESMRYCVTGWMSADDEVRAYRAWLRSKGGRR
jgi:hypothetical protein